MKRLLIFCLTTILLAAQARAQEQLSVKQQADKLYERYEYFKSLDLYLKLANKKKPDIRVLERIADCYRNINHYNEAEAWYAMAVIDTSATAITHYNYAEVLLRDQKFDKAREQYRFYFKKINDPDALALKINNCDSAALWIKRPSDYLVKDADNINSAFSEWGLAYEGKTGLLFISDRRLYNGTTDDRTGNNWFKLYRANSNGENATELPIIDQKGYLINTYHIGPIALNAKADTAYITLTTDVPASEIVIDKTGKKSTQKLYTRRLQLMVAVKKNNQWIIFSPFSYNDINRYSVGHAALSKNGRVIYFTSDMPGGEGKTDIWYCEKLANGAWDKPINCGKTINTKEEEVFPEIGGDDVLYYSSKGLPGMGGFDIYAAKGEKAQWANPVNLKYPLNSTSDDFCLVTTDGINGYLSSNRQGGKGDDDIYKFSYKKPDLITAKPKAVADVPAGLKPMPQTQPNRQTQPQVQLNPQPNLPTQPQFAKSAEAYGVNNIYYDLDRSNIRPDAVIELDKLVILLNKHPTFKVVIASHTDSRAPNDYNLALSQRRSLSVEIYLLRKGIAGERMTTEAYGETRLLNECADGVKCTEAQQQLNRRTEFKLFEE